MNLPLLVYEYCCLNVHKTQIKMHREEQEKVTKPQTLSQTLTHSHWHSHTIQLTENEDKV